MAKRVSIRYNGGSHYMALKDIPAGTVFKAVFATLTGDNIVAVYIRGSSLTKAAEGKRKFTAKQYLFVVSGGEINNQMEIIHGDSKEAR